MLQSFNYLKRKPALVFLGFVLVLFTASCSDDDTATVNNNGISEEDAADAVEMALVNDTNGLSASVNNVYYVADTKSVFTDNPDVDCGQLYSDDYASQAENGNYSYNYFGTQTYQLDCTGMGVPSVFSYTLNAGGVYDTPRMNSDDSMHAQLSLTGLALNNNELVVNGSYGRDGYQESKVRYMRNFSSELDFELSNIVFDKDVQQITQGTASVTFTGTGSGGNIYTYTGIIVFNGDGTATLTINDTIYTINL